MVEKIEDDLTESIRKVEEVKEFLTTLYYDPEFSNLMTRPTLSLLIAGCDYLSSNLRILKTKIP